MENEENEENSELNNESKLNDINLPQENLETEEEFSPPIEKNEAKRLNVGNVFGAIFIGLVLVIGTIMIFSKPRQKAQKEVALSKAGSKYIPDMKELDRKKTESFPPSENNISTEKEDDVEEILKNLPEDFKVPQQAAPSQAPVSPVGSSSSTKYERPDTRNSKSIRKVEGIGGQDHVAQSYNNGNIVSAVMNGNGIGYDQYQSYQGYSSGMSKEEYLSQLTSQSKSIASSLNIGGTGNLSKGQRTQENLENFYSSGMENGGSGEYLSFASLWEGTVISGALTTAINTDNPGLVIARVTENVYSSYDSSFLLIPEGTLLYATYNSSISYGQKRIQVAWNLLIRPDGYKVQLGNMNGVDAQGASGYRGRVSNHPFETLKALGLVAIYSLIQTEMSETIKNEENPYLQNAIRDTYSAAQKFGDKILDRALEIKPTITIKQGTEIKFILNRTLQLPPVQINQATRRYIRN